MTKELILIDVTKINAVEVFSAVENLEPILKSIEQQASSIVMDASSNKGREEIRSLAYKIAQSKTALDDAGKSLTVEWKAKVALVDSCRKQAREFLDDLKIKVRQPLTDFENAEAARIEALRLEQERIEREEKERIEAERAKAHQELLEREAALQKEVDAKNAEIARLQEEARQKELAEQRAREQAEREEGLKKEAAERAIAEERRRQEEIERQRFEKEEEEKAAIERQRLEEVKRISDEQYRRTVQERTAEFIMDFGVSEEVAFEIVYNINNGKAQHLKIIY